MNRNALKFVVSCEQEYGKEYVTLSREDVAYIVNKYDCEYPHWLVSKSLYRAGRGQYTVPSSGQKINIEETKEQPVQSEYKVNDGGTGTVLRQPKLLDESEPAIPSRYKDYIPFGFFKDMNKIVKSKQFYPIFVTGLSGNGKTLMVEQVCAELGRELIRINISVETDESDLLGGPTLVDGNVVNRDGPVLTAMKRGAVLLIDEVDRGSSKLMCLQGILEGKPYYNKKTGEVVYPKDGFNVIATANTKGRGSDEGRYLAQILDDSFLERFPITVEQEYPDVKTERKILSPLINDKDFVDNLVQWADVVRQSFEQGATDEIISTRRLVHIAKAYDIFGDRMKAIQLCLNRFDEETKTAFIDLYTKLDATIAPEVEETPVEKFDTTI